MKKQILLLTTLLASGIAAYSQITLNNVVTQYFTPDNTAPMDAHLDVINNSNNSVDINVIRTKVTLNPNHEELFCWGLYCYLPNTDTSQFPTTLAPGATEITFKPEVTPHGFDGTDILHYRFYDVNNPSDSVAVTIEFYFNTTAGLVENANESYLKFNNMVNNFTVFNYKLPAGSANSRIDIHNMLGSRINSIALSEKQGMKMVTTSDLSNGVYLVSLVVNNKTSHSYRMVVDHQKGN